MTARAGLTSLVPLLIAGCGGSAKPLPICEQGTGVLSAKTVDGAATIARVNVQPPLCNVTSGCDPGSGASDASPMLCAEVALFCFIGSSSIDFTFVSATGQSVSATATSVQSGPPFQCTNGGETITAFNEALQPTSVDIDFSKGVPADGSPD